MLLALVLTLSVAHAIAAARALKHYKAHAINYLVLVPMMFCFWPLMSLSGLWKLDDD